jgi:hypothetical protein
VGRRGRKWRGEGSGGGKGEEMTQILYAHMNKRNFKNAHSEKKFFLKEKKWRIMRRNV